MWVRVRCSGVHKAAEHPGPTRLTRVYCSLVQRLRGPVASPTPPLAQPLTELRVELEDVVQREEEEGDGVAEEL